MRYLFVFLLFTSATFSQEYLSEEVAVEDFLPGTLLVPKTDGQMPLAIILAGSGPTDRNGNQMFSQNNALRFLAEGLSSKGIATYRYDKRSVALINMRQNEKLLNIKFDDFVKDAQAIIDHFKQDSRFSHIVVIGHSKGSLVGMLAVGDGRADAFISIAGAGQPIDQVMVAQLGRQAPELQDDARKAFDDLRTRGRAKGYHQALESILGEHIQPFMLSWMAYDPAEVIAGLDTPVFIINGSEDLQVNRDEAGILKNAKRDADFLIVQNMNHVLKEVDTKDDLDNQKSYNDPNRPVAAELVDAVVGFIGKLN